MRRSCAWGGCCPARHMSCWVRWRVWRSPDRFSGAARGRCWRWRPWCPWEQNCWAQRPGCHSGNTGTHRSWATASWASFPSPSPSAGSTWCFVQWRSLPGGAAGRQRGDRGSWRRWPARCCWRGTCQWIRRWSRPGTGSGDAVMPSPRPDCPRSSMPSSRTPCSMACHSATGWAGT